MRGRVMQNKRKNYKQKRLGMKLIALGIVLCAILTLFDYRFEPTLSGICDYKCKILAFDMINDSIDTEFQSEHYTCDDFLTLVKNEDGQIVAVTTNMIMANTIVSRVASAVRARFEKTGAYTEYIKVGTLTGESYLYDRGFNIPVRIKPQGWIESDVVSNFTQTGINQTTLEIIIEVRVTFTSQLPLYSRSTKAVVQVPIAQTFINGEIPNYIGSDILANMQS